MNIEQCNAFIKDLISKIEVNILQGRKLSVAECAVTNVIKVVGGSVVNATMYAEKGLVGVEVTNAMLDGGVSDIGIKFAIAHELGHAFSSPLLDRLCLPKQNLPTIKLNGETILFMEGDDSKMREGPPEEVIADLGAVYMLHLMGLSFDDIKAAVAKDQGRIFDKFMSGHHPPASVRLDCISSFVGLLENGHPFEEAAKGVCLSMVDYKPAPKKA